MFKHDKDPFVHNVDISEEVNARTMKRRVLGKKAMDPSYDLTKLVEEEPEYIFKYKQMKTSVEAYHIDANKPKPRDGVCGLWFMGPPNSGKTFAARQIARENYDEEPFIMSNPSDGWFDGYKQQKVIVIEDLDHIGGKSIGHLIKLWADKDPV